MVKPMRKSISVLFRLKVLPSVVITHLASFYISSAVFRTLCSVFFLIGKAAGMDLSKISRNAFEMSILLVIFIELIKRSNELQFVFIYTIIDTLAN